MCQQQKESDRNIKFLRTYKAVVEDLPCFSFSDIPISMCVDQGTKARKSSIDLFHVSTGSAAAETKGEGAEDFTLSRLAVITTGEYDEVSNERSATYF